MDNKQLISTLSKRLSLDYKEVAQAISTLNDIMTECFIEGQSIAVPGFGTFSPIKHSEEITTDLASGKRLLLPPSISLQFSPANSLLNKLNQ